MLNKSQKHLKNASETYFQHMGFAIKISSQLFSGSFMAFIHAIIPSLFTTSASKKITELYSLVQNRNKK